MARKLDPRRASIFGTNLRRRRRACGLSAEALALACDISQSTLSHIENGRYAPSLELFCCLCIALDTTPNDLLSWSPNAPHLR